jgi:PST family polysaccharide transporter
LSTPEQVGYFGAAERLIALGLAMLGPASQILMPSIAHRMGHDKSAANRLVKYGLILELAYGLCVMFGGILLAPFILPFLLGNGFVPSVLPFQILVCLFPFATFRHAFGSYVLIPQKKEKWMLLAFTIGNVANLAVAFVAASYWGAMGMAAARLAGEVVIAVVLLVIALRLRILAPIFKK